MDKARAEIRRYTAKTVPEINKLLEGQGLPPLLTLGR